MTAPRISFGMNHGVAPYPPLSPEPLQLHREPMENSIIPRYPIMDSDNLKDLLMRDVNSPDYKYERACEQANAYLAPLRPTGSRLYSFKFAGTIIEVDLSVGEGGHATYKCRSDGLPENQSIVVCNAGIAVGRIPQIDLGKAIYHQNRVTLLFWHEAESIISLESNKPIKLVVPDVPVLNSESKLADYLICDYFAKRCFIPLAEQDFLRKVEQVYKRLDKLSELASELEGLTEGDEEPLEKTESATQTSEEATGQENGPVQAQQTNADGPAQAQQTNADGPAQAQQTNGDGPAQAQQTNEDGQEGTTETTMTVVDYKARRLAFEEALKIKDVNRLIEVLRKEAEFWGISPDVLPDAEEYLAKANLPPKADSNLTMTAEKFAGVVRDVLNKSIGKLFASISKYYVDPQKPLTKAEMRRFKEHILYVMGGLNCQSAETSAVSYKGGQEVSTTGSLAFRRKITPDAYKFLYEDFTKELRASQALAPLFRTMFGFIIAAVDGSDISLLRNISDPETSCKGKNGTKPYNQIHLNCIYDCLNFVYLTAQFAGSKKTGTGERNAFYEMLDGLATNIRKNILITCDRGYESLEALAQLALSGSRYILRVKSTESNGILKHFPGLESYGECFQVWIKFRLSKKEMRGCDDGPMTIVKKYACLDEDEPLELKIRVLQFRLPSGELETLITNVPMWELSPYHLYCIYGKRWGIEQSYRMFKYQFSVKQQHSKKPQYVKQELWAKLVMFNFASFIMGHTTIPETKRKQSRKYEYMIKHSRGIVLCRRLMAGNIDLEEFGKLLVQRLQPIRPDRNYPRKVRPQPSPDSQTLGVGM